MQNILQEMGVFYYLMFSRCSHVYFVIPYKLYPNLN